MNENRDLFNNIEKQDPVHGTRDFDPDAADMDDIIELTDVVQEGEMVSESIKAPVFLDPEAPEESPFKLHDHAKPDGTPVQSVDVEGLDEFPGAGSDDAFSALESSDFQFENSPAFEEDDVKFFSEPASEGLDDVLAHLEEEDAEDEEKPEDILKGIEAEASGAEEAEVILTRLEEEGEAERPGDILASLEEKDDKDKEAGESTLSRDIPGISEEKMKEHLTGIIKDTVDKAIRETVAAVAEKVIREAIESLKQSIASSGDSIS